MPFKPVADWQVHDRGGQRKYLNRAEYMRFLAAADRLDPGPRALCYTLALTGCRVSEALSLSVPQLDPENGALIVKTLKRRRIVFRAVPIPLRLTRMLLDVPLHTGGRFWIMHRSSAWRLIKQTMKAAEITGPMACCKGLRHSFGIRAIGCNVPPNLVQRWMGHATPSTTTIYLDAVGPEERAFAHRMW